jgi:hypothetical protein
MTTYFYNVQAGDIRTLTGESIPNPGNIMSFVATPEQARSQFFMMGFDLDTGSHIFADDGRRFVSEEFATGEVLPNSLEVLTGGKSPFPGEIPIADMIFGKLIVNRFSNPTSGGKRLRRTRRQRTRRSRVQRK